MTPEQRELLARYPIACPLKLRAVITNEDVARQFQAVGPEQLRAAVRRMYESKVFN